MAQTPLSAARIDPQVIEAARVAARLPATASTAYVLRYALAKLAGVVDVERVARGRRVGHPGKAARA